MVGLPVYSMETSSCFLGVVTPSPGFSMIFSTPMLVTDVDIGINGEGLRPGGVWRLIVSSSSVVKSE
jgi:hypothetical protein